MLEINNISSFYGNKQILYETSLNVNEDIILLSGENGSGKSTLLKCIYNLLSWDGQILFNGESLKSFKTFELITKGIAYVPQQNFCFDDLSIEENLKVAGNIIPKKRLDYLANEILELTGLVRFKNRKPFNLSGGEKKLLAFSMAFIHQPKLLLLDEIFSGMDAENSAILLFLIDYLISINTKIIFVEHNHIVIEDFITKKLYMKFGKIYNS